MRTLTHRRAHRTLATLTVLVSLAGASGSHAAATPEEKCQKGRHNAAAKYAQCQTKAIGNFHGGGTTAKLEDTLSKCRVKYTDTWLKLQKTALGTGATCDAPRFVNGVGSLTVIDNLTGLEWEKKTDAGTVHDKDNIYSWFNAYTVFLELSSSVPHGLNQSQPPNFGGCFMFPCNWRLPTRAELQTILSEPHPCTTDPCIDGIFGPTSSGFYWTATSHASDDTRAWTVAFSNGFVAVGAPVGDKTTPNFVRAVRGGL